MPIKTRKVKKRIIPTAPKLTIKTVKKTPKINPLYQRRPKNFSIGGDIQPKRDLTRYVRWPRYIRIQRQKRILMQRLKIPPALNQFNQTLKKQTTTQIFRLLHKYRPETTRQKKNRLLRDAESLIKGKKQIAPKKQCSLKFGINHVTYLIEEKKAKLVIVAHDVSPIELVVWLPALCRKMNVPYCIVSGKSRLGKLVHKKTATSIAVTDVSAEDKSSFSNIIDAVKSDYNDRFEEIRKSWGGGIMGSKSRARTEKIEKKRIKELQHK